METTLTLSNVFSSRTFLVQVIRYFNLRIYKRLMDFFKKSMEIGAISIFGLSALLLVELDFLLEPGLAQIQRRNLMEPIAKDLLKSKWTATQIHVSLTRKVRTKSIVFFY